MLFVIDLPPTLRTETDGVKPVLVIARDAVVLVAVVVDAGMRLAHIRRPQPLLLVGLGAGIARQSRGDGEDSKADDGDLDEGVHAVPCALPLPLAPARKSNVWATWSARGSGVPTSSATSLVPRETALVHSLSQSVRLLNRARRPDDLGFAQTKPRRAP